jgi:hypothetical protein
LIYKIFSLFSHLDQAVLAAQAARQQQALLPIEQESCEAPLAGVSQ